MSLFSTHGAWTVSVGSLLTATLLIAILSFSPTYTKPGILKLQPLTVCVPDCVICARPCPQDPCMCVHPPPQFQHICHFLRYICAKV